MTDVTLITNLLYRYAELMDLGDFRGAAGLFAKARLRVGHRGEGDEYYVDASGMCAIWETTVVRYPDGTPRTKHVTTNPIVEVDVAAGTATVRSYYTVFQQVDDFGLQPVISGRYHDRFAKIDGTWHFVERDYTLVDLIGDVSRHLTIAL